MKPPFLSLSLPLALFLSSSSLLTADEKETIGLTDLLTREPGLNGSGLRIAQIEADSNTNEAIDYEIYQPNPATASQDPSKFSYFDSDNTYLTPSDYESKKQSGHANLVANNYFDTNTGVATDVAEIYVFNANTFYTNIIATSTNINAKVINQSFVFGAQDTTADRLYDNYADLYQTLFVNGIQNSTGIAIASPATSYNGIAVGKEDLNHSPNPTDGRSKPELIAPGSASSYSTPYVAGSATILIEAALLLDGGTGTATSASDIRTIKALLLNGAVKDTAWSNTTTHPLDTRRGAGMLNVNNSHLILQGGKHSPTSSQNSSIAPTYTPASGQAGNVSSPSGWNFSTIQTFLPANDRIDNYYFDIPSSTSPLYDLTTTLVWHRQSGQTDINNLDLILYNADTGAVVEQSISTVDNVEHIHTRDLPAGRYVIQVIKRRSSQTTNSEDYALAFNFSVPAPDAPTLLTATAQPYSEIDLNWTDNSNDELNFELQRSPLSGRAFNTIATLPANTITYTDTAPSESTTYYYRVKATNSNGDSFYTNVASATTFSPLMNWRQDNFSSSADSGDAANSADPDHDGLNNLTEYALGTDPTSAADPDGSSATPKASIVTDNGIDYLQITVTRTSIKSNITYTIQLSPDLESGNWTEATDILENSTTTLRVRDNLPVSDHARRFIRLKVTEK
ncbi:MAG: hypothetical protein ACSHX6_05495 [Akkermansiaceae bacterium]